MKIFLWRACKAILPTKANLFDKGISNSFSCVWCEDAVETGDHLLWGCEFAQRVWQECPVQIPLNSHDGLSFKEFIMGCVSEVLSPGLEIVFTMAWAIWRARNEVV